MKPKLNRTSWFFKYSNKFNQFFFHDLIFSIILFFNFFSLIDFLLTVKFILFKLKGKKIRTEEGMVHKKETEVFGGPI
jgi:hypothetical protein